MGRIVIGVILAAVFVLVITPFSSIADQANYYYDDAGRLIRMARGTDGIMYVYDEVGNLLSTTKETIGTDLPVLQSINPDVFPLGPKVLAILTGQNLWTTTAVQSNNSYLSISVVSITDTEIKAEITVPSGTPPDPVALTVVTAYGSASIQATITSATLSFSPSSFALTPGNTGTITASLTPPAGRDVTIVLKNSNPSVVSVPQSVVIPSGGTTTFAATPVMEGLATISSGDATVDISVIGNVITTSRPVSLGIDAPLGGNVSTTARPVSIYLDAPLGGNATTTALPVSIYLDAPLVGTATIQSHPASVYIDPPLGNATVMSLPVSTQKAQP